jgi:hypothetical protein
MRWRLPSPAAERDVVRLWIDGEVSVAAIANAYDSAFSTCWPAGSRLLLDRLEAAWAAASGSLPERVGGAFAAAAAAFVAEAPALAGGPGVLDEVPVASLTVVATDGASACAAWLGAHAVLQVRGVEVVATTTPHTLRAEHPEAPDVHAAIVTRTIGAGNDTPATERFALAAGDTLVIARGAPVAAVALAAAGYLAPRRLAEHLVDLPFAADGPFAAVAAIRSDGFDLAAVVDRLIDAYTHDPRHQAWLDPWARRERALPVWFDMGGVLGLRGDGAMVGALWDHPGPAEVETDPNLLLAARVAAARLPALAALAVPRPAAAPDCRFCAGTRCPVCWQLGWEPLNALPG